VSGTEPIQSLEAADRLVQRVGEAVLPLEQGRFTVVGYRDLADGREHLALVLGELSARAGVLVRLHSECLTGDVFHSRRCDCGTQLHLALGLIADEGAGAVIYLRGHEGRGIGLLAKIRAYQLQDDGLDTVEANLRLGHLSDGRDYGVGAAMLADLGVASARLLTNNPAKVSGLEQAGMCVSERLPLITVPTADNVGYLRAKQVKLGHLLEPSFSH
jgi:3,4-dihydroxy 2-butanone 4-phosphate synthase / GTP cyclohydrolase II